MFVREWEIYAMFSLCLTLRNTIFKRIVVGWRSVSKMCIRDRVNIWLGEFSQAGNEESDFDKVTKGSYEFDDETPVSYTHLDVYKRQKYTSL